MISLSREESLQFYYWLSLSVLSFEIQFSEWEEWNRINWCILVPFLCLSTWISNLIKCCGLFYVWWERLKSSIIKFEFTCPNQILEFIFINVLIKTEKLTGPNKVLLVLVRVVLIIHVPFFDIGGIVDHHCLNFLFHNKLW